MTLEAQRSISGGKTYTYTCEFCKKEFTSSIQILAWEKWYTHRAKCMNEYMDKAIYGWY